MLVTICNANTRGAKGLCLEVNDLAIAKYVARRDKDRDYLRVAINAGLLDKKTLHDRLHLTQVGVDHRQLPRAVRWFTSSSALYSQHATSIACRLESLGHRPRRASNRNQCCLRNGSWFNARDGYHDRSGGLEGFTRTGFPSTD